MCRSTRYKKEVTLSAVLCFHRITDGVAWTPSNILSPLLRELCGNDIHSRIGLVTTMWDKVNVELGRRRLEELENNHWDGLVQHGSTHRHLNTPKSAKAILHHILEENKRWRSVPQISMDSSYLKVEDDLTRNDILIAYDYGHRPNFLV